MRLKKLLLIGDKLLCSTRSTSMDWTEDHDFELLCNYTSSQVVFEEFVHELEVGLSAIHPCRFVVKEPIGSLLEFFGN